jgi:hypothetical protein
MTPLTPITSMHRPQFWVQRHASDAAKGLGEWNPVNSFLPPLPRCVQGIYRASAQGICPRNRAGSGAHTATPTLAQPA